MKKQLSRFSALFVGAAAVGAICSAGGGASAWWVRQHANNCMDESKVSSNMDKAMGGNENFTVWCPATDTSAMPKHRTTVLNVHGGLTNGQVAAQACIKNAWVAGGSCTSVGFATPTMTGPYSVTISTAIWGTSEGSGNFGYYRIVQPYGGPNYYYGSYQEGT